MTEFKFGPFPMPEGMLPAGLIEGMEAKRLAAQRAPRFGQPIGDDGEGWEFSDPETGAIAALTVYAHCTRNGIDLPPRARTQFEAAEAALTGDIDALLGALKALHEASMYAPGERYDKQIPATRARGWVRMLALVGALAEALRMGEYGLYPDDAEAPDDAD